MPDLFHLDGRVVIVTGGLGQLGRQFTRAVIAAGGRVGIFDMNTAARRPSLGPLADSPDICLTDVDVTDRDSVAAGLNAVVERLGPVYGLVNNAALDSPPGSPAEENGPFETYPLASWKKVFDVNTTGVFLCDQIVGGHMANNGRGSIIHVASIYGVVSPDQRIYEYRQRAGGQPFYKPVAYSASKSSLINLTKYLATYWAKDGVRVNTVTFAGVFNNQDEEFLKGYCAKVPLGRMAREDEYNGAVVFLMSDAASYMTGANMVLDGGFTAW